MIPQADGLSLKQSHRGQHQVMVHTSGAFYGDLGLSETTWQSSDQTRRISHPAIEMDRTVAPSAGRSCTQETAAGAGVRGGKVLGWNCPWVPLGPVIRQSTNEFPGSSLQRPQPIVPLRYESHRPRMMRMVLAAERWNARPLAGFESGHTTPMPFMLSYWSPCLPSMEGLTFALSWVKHDGMPLPQFPSEAGASALLALCHLVYVRSV